MSRLTRRMFCSDAYVVDNPFGLRSGQICREAVVVPRGDWYCRAAHYLGSGDLDRHHVAHTSLNLHPDDFLIAHAEQWPKGQHAHSRGLDWKPPQIEVIQRCTHLISRAGCMLVDRTGRKKGGFRTIEGISFLVIDPHHLATVIAPRAKPVTLRV